MLSLKNRKYLLPFHLPFQLSWGRVVASTDARQPGQLCRPLAAHGHLLLLVAKPVQQGRAFGVPAGSEAQVAVIPAP
jgi:hypothetical protein